MELYARGTELWFKSDLIGDIEQFMNIFFNTKVLWTYGLWPNVKQLVTACDFRPIDLCFKKQRLGHLIYSWSAIGLQQLYRLCFYW